MKSTQKNYEFLFKLNFINLKSHLKYIIKKTI